LARGASPGRSVRFQSANPRGLTVKDGDGRRQAVGQETLDLQGYLGTRRRLRLCLPCRRSRVRIPSAALKKARICRPFLRAQSACASASGRTGSGLAAGRSSAVPRKTACLQVDSGSSEPKSFCGPAEGQVFGLLQPLRRLLLQRHDPADSARRRETSGRVPLGESGFSPETALDRAEGPRPGSRHAVRRPRTSCALGPHAARRHGSCAARVAVQGSRCQSRRAR
jgi:hypothetical protein